MSRNRIPGWLSQTSWASARATPGFVICPAVLMTVGGVDELALRRRLYQWAMDQAAAVVRPSIVARFQKDLLN